MIRHAIAKQGLPEEEHYFFRREMRFRAKIGTVFERLPYILYQSSPTSETRSYARPWPASALGHLRIGLLARILRPK